FTVDLSLDGLSQFVSELRVSPRGRAFIAAGTSQLVAAPGGVDASGRVQWDDGALVGEVLKNLRESVAGAHVFEHAGERFLGGAGTFKGGGRGWVAAIVVPDRDYPAAIDAQTWRAAGLGLLALLVAVGGGIVLVQWIAQPLRELGAQARRIREGDLDVTIVPH